MLLLHACLVFDRHVQQCLDIILYCAGWLRALPHVGGTQDNQQEGYHSHGRSKDQHTPSCRAAAVSQEGRGHPMGAAAHQADHLGSCAMPEPAMQHVCQHHMLLPDKKPAEPAQQRLISCSACFQPLHTIPEAKVVSSASACLASSSCPSCPAPARAAAALASRAIKQRAAGPSPSSSAHNPEVARSQCHVCSAQYKAADAVSTSVVAASWSQQEHCCDCGYVTKSPSLGPYKLGLARPASAGGCRAVTSPACRPLSADVGTTASHLACRPTPADVIRAASRSACRPLSADVGTAATGSACRTLPAYMKGAGEACTQSASAVDLDGAVGHVLSQSVRSAAALTPVTQQQQEYRSPLSHLQQSFKAELGIPNSVAARVDSPILEAAQGQHTKSPNVVGSCCFLDGSVEVVHRAAAAHLVYQGATWAHDREQPLEVSPETSFLQMLDQCKQTDPDSLRVQPDQQQQTDASFATTGDMPDFAKHSGCSSPQPVDVLRQQRVPARALGSFNAQPQATAVATSPAPASTAVAAASSEAFSSGLAAILDDSSAANAAGQRYELCQLGAIIADKDQSMRPRPLAGSFSQLLGFGMPPRLQSAPPASGMPSTLEAVTGTASGTEDSLAGHAGFDTSSVAADTSAVQAMSLPAVSAPGLGPRNCAAWQLGTHVDNAQEPALQMLPVRMAQCSSSQGLPVSSAEPGVVQQQHPQHEASTHAETEHKSASADAVDVGVETDHRWLLSTAWAEQRQWIAARRRSGEVETKWELDESGSISGDSEGSVSSESTLRPSSVGRCRVNCGRNAKVGTAVAR